MRHGRLLAASVLVLASSVVIAQDVPREFAMLTARDLTLACTVHTTFMATTAAMSEGGESSVRNLVRLALVWKREASREQNSQVETQGWRRRIEEQNFDRTREQVIYCAGHADSMFKAMPKTLQQEMRDDAQRQTGQLLEKYRKNAR
jgi:hypothetical protein